MAKKASTGEVEGSAFPRARGLSAALISVRREMDALSSAQLGLVLVLFSIFMVIPLLSVVYLAFFTYGTFSLFWFQLIFTNPTFFPITITGKDAFPFLSVNIYTTGRLFYQAGDALYLVGIDFGVILNSVSVALIVALISTIVGTVLAFIMARYEFPAKTVFRTALLVPILSTPFVGAIGIQRMIGENGVLNMLFYETLHILPAKIVLDGFAAMIFVQTLSFYAIVYLNAYSAFVNIDPSLEEQAENMGSKGLHLLRTITLPLALPGIEAGAILTFILSVEDLGTPIVFQTSQASKTLTFQIFNRIFAPTGEIDPLAPALGLILLVIAMSGFIVIRKYVLLRRYAMISRGGAWHPRVRRIGGAKLALVYAFMLCLLAVALIPHTGVILLSFAEYWGWTILPARFTLQNYGIIFTDPAITPAIVNSFLYSFAATTLITVVGTGAAYVIDRKRIPGKGLIDMLVTMPVAIPGIVIGIGFFTTFLRTPLSPVINPVPLLVLSYTIRKFPFTVRAAYAGLQQTPVELEEVSLNLGAGRLRTFLRIAIPLIGINVLAGGMLSFVYSMSEVSTSLILGGVNPSYAPMTWKIKDVLTQVGAGPFYAAALGVLLMAVQLVVIVISTRILKQRASALTGL